MPARFSSAATWALNAVTEPGRGITFSIRTLKTSQPSRPGVRIPTLRNVFVYVTYEHKSTPTATAEELSIWRASVQTVARDMDIPIRKIEFVYKETTD